MPATMRPPLSRMGEANRERLREVLAALEAADAAEAGATEA
jgi:hypothetical protein